MATQRPSRRVLASAAERAEALHQTLETLISWKVVSGLGVLVTIPRVPEMIRAAKG